MYLKPGSTASLCDQMLKDMLDAVDKPDAISQHARDNFVAALKWMLKNIRSYQQLRMHDLPRALMKLKKMPLIPDDLKDVVKTVETAWRAIVDGWKLKHPGG